MTVVYERLGQPPQKPNASKDGTSQVWQSPQGRSSLPATREDYEIAPRR